MRVGDDLRITIEGQSDAIVIVNHFAMDGIGDLAFTNGTTWNIHGGSVLPLTGDALVIGGHGRDVFLINPDGGSKTIYAEGGDTLDFAGIDSTEVRLIRTGSDLELFIDRTRQSSPSSTISAASGGSTSPTAGPSTCPPPTR